MERCPSINDMDCQHKIMEYSQNSNAGYIFTKTRLIDSLWQKPAEKRKKQKDGIEKDRNCTYCFIAKKMVGVVLIVRKILSSSKWLQVSEKWLPLR